MKLLSENAEIDVVVQGTVLGDDLEYLAAALDGRLQDLDGVVEASRSQQGIVEQLRPVGASDDGHPAPVTDAVHEAEQLVQEVVLMANALATCP